MGGKSLLGKREWGAAGRVSSEAHIEPPRPCLAEPSLPPTDSQVTAQLATVLATLTPVL